MVEEELEMEASFTSDEIIEAVRWDGILVEYYIKMESVLLQPLKKLLDKIWTLGKILKSWNEAMITLIHKPERDKKEIKNFRPLSLLNLD